MNIPEAEQAMIEALGRGETVVFKIPGRGGRGHTHVFQWAKEHDRYVRIDRQPWRGPVVTGNGNLDAVFRYALWAGLNDDELSKHLPTLRGKALGCSCQCAPAWCHGRTLIGLLSEAPGKNSKPRLNSQKQKRS